MVPSSSTTPLRAAALHDDLLAPADARGCHAGGLGGDAQRLRELAVVDLVILRRKQRAGDLAGKTRLARPRRRGRQPFERQIEPALKLQPVRDLGLIVGGQGEHQRALAPQFDVDAACASQLLGEGRASAPGSRGRARPAPLRRARPRSRPPACRRRHGSRPMPALPRSNTVTAARAASRQAMPSPITPAPMMTTRGGLPPDVRE